MSVLSPSSLAETPIGVGVERSGPLDDYTVDFITFTEASSLGELLKGLPDDRCQCPHWGVLHEGRLTVEYADRTEVVEAGDAYYLAPGHVPTVTAGTRLTQFSPTADLAATNAAIQSNAERLASP